MDVEKRFETLGIALPEPPKAVGMYEPLIITGNYIYTSGNLPVSGGELRYKGKLGDNVSIEEGFAAAQLCTLNALAAIKGKIGNLNKILRVVKVNGYVNCTPDFTEQPKVVNGASKMLADLFEEQGLHARTAVGVNGLPLGAPVEVEYIFQLSG